MKFAEAFFLACLQGIAEFLPISSSGHLATLQHFFSVSGEEALVVSVFAHFGTLLSIFFFLREEITRLFAPFLKPASSGKLEATQVFLRIIVASIPVAIIGFFFRSLVVLTYQNLKFIAVNFFITALIILFLYLNEKRKTLASHNQSKKPLYKNIHTIPYASICLIGLTQAMAVLPGISRSGITITSAVFLNVEIRTAASFSFLLVIPAILGSFFFEVLENPDVFLQSQYFFIIVVSAIVGFFSLKILYLSFERKNYIFFSYYLFLLAGCLFLYAILHG